MKVRKWLKMINLRILIILKFKSNNYNVYFSVLCMVMMYTKRLSFIR